MFFCVCGPISMTAMATHRVVTLIAQETIGLAEQIWPTTREQVREGLKARAAEMRASVLAFIDIPETKLLHTLTDSKIPIVICEESYEEAIAFQATIWNSQFTDALRRTNFSFVQLSQLARNAATFVVNRARCDSMLVIDFAKELIDLFQVPCTDKQFEALAFLLSGSSRATTFREFAHAQFPTRLPVHEWRKTLSVGDRMALQNMVDTHVAGTEFNAVQEFYWPRCLFYDCDVPDMPLLGSKLLVGPARGLVYGPYLHLISGWWHAEVQIEVRDCQVDTLAMMEVFAGLEVTEVFSMRLPVNDGSYAINVEFGVSETSRPIQFRFQMLKGAIQGEFLLNGARLRRMQ